jgi:dUTP pyrophosphatase
MYGLGIAVEIPQGYFGLITSRSSIKDKDLRIIPGIIDSDYTGEIFAVFTETSSPAKIYKIGERVAQLLIMPICNSTITVSEELYESERGQQGFGSTGNEAILVNV